MNLYLQQGIIHMILFISLSNTVQSLLILAVLVTFLACGTIFLEKNGNPKLRLLLFVILSEIGLHFLVILFVLIGLIQDFPFLIRGIFPYFYLIQPAIYFYVVVNLNENYEFTKKDLLHLTPAILSLIDNCGFYLGGPEHWQYWSNSISNNFAEMAKYPGILMLSKYNFIFLDLLNISYTLFAWRYYFHFIKNNQEIKDQFVLKWLKMFLIIISIFIFSLASNLICNFKYLDTIINNSNTSVLITFCLIVFSILAFSCYILFNPILLYGLPKINYDTIADNVNTLPNFKSNKNAIEDHNIKEFELAQTIISEIKEKQLYKNKDFSISLASQHFSIPIHHISFIINNHVQKSFPDIVCELRIDHAIQLLKDNRNKKYTMEAIGNLSGFKSRSTFYSSFKKITGITPNEYYQNLKKA
jgi:AraC-like DNA-binding protein